MKFLSRSPLSAVTISLGLIAALSGCSAGGGSAQSPTPTETPKVYVTAPLTGLQFEEGTNLAISGPAVSCKVDNLDVARPQLNLNKTDMVYVEMVEGGLTRFVAVFHSQMPEAAGPVRSIRPMDPDIISPFGGIVCYSGGQYKFVKMMQATNVFNANETEEQGKGTFTRAADREAPHNVIVNISKLQQAHPELPAPAPQFKFASSAESSASAASGKLVESVKIYYPLALSQWTPSTDGTKWLRTQDSKVHTDVADGSQLAATNVVVLQVSIDRTYGYVPKTTLVDSGKAWVFTQGRYIIGTWSKASQTAPIVLTDESGAEILLAAGNTWVELMPKAPEGKLTIAEKVEPKPTSTPKK